MYITKKTYSAKKVTIAAICLATLLFGVVFALESIGIINLLSDTPKSSQEQEAKVNTDAKRDFIENGPGSGTKEDTTPTNSPSDNVQKKIELSAKQETNGSITVLTKLFGYSDGKCTLAVSNAGKTTTQSADVIYQPEFSSCAGFSVPIGQLGNGHWSIQLTVTASDNSSTSKTISLEVK